MIILFDIDGTLIRAGGAGRRALARAFEAEVGITDAMEGIRLDGNTDPIIIRTVFESRLGRSPTDAAEERRVLTRYLVYLREELTSPQANYEVLSGAKALLDRLASLPHFFVGLATGNIEEGARMKLEIGGLVEYFHFGGYGSDSALRHELVSLAVDRGQQLSMTRLGRRMLRDEVVVIGDTERDVEAAHKAGVRSVGVLHGCTKPDLLLAAEPDHVASSLRDPLLWSWLGLDPDLELEPDLEPDLEPNLEGDDS